MDAAVLALAAAVVFGTGTALQHRAASGILSTTTASSHLFARLLRRPDWLAGLCLSGLAFTLHVAALHRGPLLLVQPVVVTTTVFAVFVRAALERRVPDRGEVVWGACAWGGLMLFVATVHTRPSRFVADEQAAATFVVAAAGAALVSAGVAGRVRVRARRGLLLAVAAGILYGVTAGLIKVTAASDWHEPASLVRHWSVWLVAPVGLSAFFLSQRAYQASRLSMSAPVVNIVDVLVAVTFGIAVFGDHLFESPAQLVIELVSATMIGVGVWRLVREDERLHQSRELVST